jgi:O-antigen ligase/polysaccharide polymerase Wzy-like membrane protein
VPILERVSKIAAAASVALIVLLLLAFHPDITPALRALTIAAIVAGALTPASRRSAMHTAWVATAMLSPAVLRAITSREGPVLDLFWMAGLSASLLRSESWSRWSMPERWRGPAGGVALTLALAWPVLLAREIGFDPRTLTDEGAVNSWALLTAPQVAAWLLFVVWTLLLGLLWLDSTCRELHETPGGVPRVVHGIWIGTTIASLVAVYQGTIDLHFFSTPFWAARARATGTLLDANAFGVCAALAPPLAYLALCRPRAGERSRTSASSAFDNHALRNAIVFFVFVVNLAGLWLSGSRTAMLCGAVAMTMFVAAAWSSFTPRARRIIPWAAIAAIAIVGAIVLTSKTIGPAQRFADIPTELRSALSTVFTRGPYGRIANLMIREHPLVGVGIGSYQILAADYWRRLDNNQLQFDNAQNWLRHVLSEMGIVGSAMLFIFAAFVAWHVVMRPARPDLRVAATIVRGLVAAIGISSFIQVPTQTPIVMLSFMLLVGWMTVLIPEREPQRHAATKSPFDSRRSLRAGWQWIAATIAAVAYAGGHLALANGSLAVVERARRAHLEYAAGTYPPEVADGVRFRWTSGNARFVWPATTRWLVVRVWAQHPDIASRPVRITLTTNCGVIVDEEFTSAMPLSLGVALPEQHDALEAHLKVSRTWRPSDYGSNDERRLGAAIVAEFVADPSLTRAQNRHVALSACGPGI